MSRVNFARSCTLDKVNFGLNNTIIILIDGVPIEKWNSHILLVFYPIINTNIPNKAKIKANCLTYTINFKNSGDVCEQLKTGRKLDSKKK